MKLLRRQRPEAVRGKYADNHYAEYREESNLAEAAFVFSQEVEGLCLCKQVLKTI